MNSEFAVDWNTPLIPLCVIMLYPKYDYVVIMLKFRH